MKKNRVLSKFKRIVHLAKHSGRKYLCPFCGYKSKDLAPIGLKVPVLHEKQVIGAGRREGGCHKCGSTDRERLLYAYLMDKLDILNNKDLIILHLAPEYNISKIFIREAFENYVCGDLFTKGYQYPQYVQRMNVTDLPFEDNFYDLIICNHLLEHVPDDKAAMKELYRVLKPDGKAIVQVPISSCLTETVEDLSVTDPKKRQELFGQFDHVRIYGQDYFDRLSSAGFRVEKLSISNEFPKYGLNEKEKIFVAKK